MHRAWKKKMRNTPRNKSSITQYSINWLWINDLLVKSSEHWIKNGNIYHVISTFQTHSPFDIFLNLSKQFTGFQTEYFQSHKNISRKLGKCLLTVFGGYFQNVNIRKLTRNSTSQAILCRNLVNILQLASYYRYMNFDQLETQYIMQIYVLICKFKLLNI